jgi:hypothetical protein
MFQFPASYKIYDVYYPSVVSILKIKHRVSIAQGRNVEGMEPAAVLT